MNRYDGNSSIVGRSAGEPSTRPRRMSSKLIVRLVGGLGNQMFGYAAARRLAHVNGAELVIDDRSGFSRDLVYRRRYALKPFRLSARLATNWERLLPFERPRRALLEATARRRPFAERRYIRQEGPAFESRLLDVRLRGTTLMEGVWPSEDYFKDIGDRIRREFAIESPADPRNREVALAIEGSQSVALHVRWFKADAANTASNLDIGYYHRATEAIRSRLDGAHFFVFSDRPEAAAEKLGLRGGSVTLVDHNTNDDAAHLDLWLMSKCRHAVIANSTFSWWGAWLGDAADRMVIAPDPERYPAMGWSSERFLPDRWTRLSS